MRARILLLLVASALLAGCGGSSSSRSSTGSKPTGGELVGVMFNGPVLADGVSLDRQLDLALASGVESLRVSVDWSSMEPVPRFAELPTGFRSQFEDVGGAPIRFAALDRVVGAAAQRGMSVLPVIEYTPGWDALRPGNPASPPKSLAPFAAFLTALEHRYGPGGSFWSAHPRIAPVPIRTWQIWNEPHFTHYWTAQPFAPSYVKLLGAAHAALKAADPNAKIVLAGLANFSWKYLAQIYAIRGASRLFDVVAIHPYTARPQGVITILQRARAVMSQHGDASKPILATEITWDSSLGKTPPQFGIGTTEQGQAQLLNQLMPLLARDRAKLGLMGFYWYTWMGDEVPGSRPDAAFDYAGLLKYSHGTIKAKPALDVYKHWALRIEGCQSKSKVATRCA
ncbi:MAG: hypothetical protein J2P43_08915 [Candidatus Dormibacteraeota bacterium]|nr:hypothetical protein [Candidatus Dormibacteraeota bacterium]